MGAGLGYPVGRAYRFGVAVEELSKQALGLADPWKVANCEFDPGTNTCSRNRFWTRSPVRRCEISRAFSGSWHGHTPVGTFTLF